MHLSSLFTRRLNNIYNSIRSSIIQFVLTKKDWRLATGSLSLVGSFAIAYLSDTFVSDKEAFGG